jgi:hypothetical protein
MKALRTTLAAVVLFIGAMTVNAQSMSIAAMRSNARFLTDRMAYTLGIRDPYLIDEIYRINYDYIWGVNEYLDDVTLGYYYTDYMTVVEARDVALQNLLGYTLWNRLINYTYFHRPIVFANRGWHFSIYDYDRYGVNRFYYHAPRPLVTYVGGHFFRPMAPRGGRIVAPAPHAVPRGGVAPRPGGAPHPGGAYRGAVPRGGQMNTPAPRMNNNNRNMGGNYNHNYNNNVNNNNNNVNINVNSNANAHSNPGMNRGNANMGASNMNRGNANAGAPNMNRSTPNMGNQMRSGSNMNSSSRQPQTRPQIQQQTRTSAPSFTNASMTTRSNAGATMNRGGGATMNRGGGATMNRGGGPVGRGGGRR